MALEGRATCEETECTVGALSRRVAEIGFLVETLRTREDAGSLTERAIAWGNTALLEYREGTHDVEMAWAARDVPTMNRAVRRIRSARSLLERALDAGRMESA